LGAVVILAFAGFAGAAGQGKDKDKDTVDLKKLMGKWEPKEGKITIEFADKGKMVVALDSNGKSEKFEGTYKVTGNKLEIAVTIMGKEQKESLTVKKLTDDELVTVDSKNMEDTLKKKK
jgi:uncharacterized protein (TIGR03066 family)